MSRLTQWFGRLTGCGFEGRKRARYRAYRSEALICKMRLVQKEQRQPRRGKSGQ